jgi:protein dithiol oxidoreductase (disulfide-forming)
MKRREFAFGIGTLAMGGAMPWPVRAQEVPVELQDYVRLSKQVPVELPAGKRVEVVSFFWYECPHCNAFEPMLDAWVGRLAPDVEFRQVPVGFTPRHEVTQRLFYALRAMGRVGDAGLHAKVYDAIHNRWRRPSSEAQWADFVAGHGVDRARFVEVFRSDEVTELLRKANQWAADAEIEGVPTLVVQGRYTTSPARAGSRDRALSVADYLIGLARNAP